MAQPVALAGNATANPGRGDPSSSPSRTGANAAVTTTPAAGSTGGAFSLQASIAGLLASAGLVAFALI
jgi:hypothetical protein